MVVLQVEDRPEEEKEDQKDDIPGEDNAVEMSNDFEGKFQDNEQMEKEDQEELENEEEVCDHQTVMPLNFISIKPMRRRRYRCVDAVTDA